MVVYMKVDTRMVNIMGKVLTFLVRVSGKVNMSVNTRMENEMGMELILIEMEEGSWRIKRRQSLEYNIL